MTSRRLQVMFAHVWFLSDLRGAVRGHEWVTLIAVLCLTFTTAASTVLHAAAAAMVMSIRSDLAGSGRASSVVKAASVNERCRLDDATCGARSLTRSGALAAFARVTAASKAASSYAMVTRAQGSIELRYERSRPVDIIGSQSALLDLQPITVLQGRPLFVADERRGQAVALLGKRLVDSVYAGRLPASVRISGVRVEIVGMVESSPMSTVQVDDAVLMPHSVTARVVGHSGVLDMFIVRDERDQPSGDIRDELVRFERGAARFAAALHISTVKERLGELADLEDALGRGIAGLSLLLVASAAVAVSALMVTLARSHARGVGIARALGAARALVLLQGTFTGCVVGVAGTASGWVAALAVIATWPSWLDVAPPETPAVGIAMMRGAAPSFAVCILTAVWAFAWLSRRTPARLLG